VIFGRAGGIAHDAFEDFEHSQRANLQAGLFAHLAPDAVFAVGKPPGVVPRIGSEILMSAGDLG
jgi:hypothetical protein